MLSRCVLAIILKRMTMFIMVLYRHTDTFLAYTPINPPKCFSPLFFVCFVSVLMDLGSIKLLLQLFYKITFIFFKNEREICNFCIRYCKSTNIKGPILCENCFTITCLAGQSTTQKALEISPL